MKHISRAHHRARIYQSLRTAHLERFHSLEPAVVLFQSKRYDFAENLTIGLHLIQAGPIRAAWLVATSRLLTVEMNEPLMRASLPATFWLLAGVRLRELVGLGRIELVAYAIENRDPFFLPKTSKLRSRIRRRAEYLIAGFAWRRLDRVAFGTDASRALYGTIFPTFGPGKTATVQALPAKCNCEDEAIESGLVVFLGAFSERKGILRVLGAWSEVNENMSAARLTVMGKGPLEGAVRDFAERADSISCMIDPPRAEIHAVLRRCSVLVLPSLPGDEWKEQVGLPIVEGLAHGCKIVTTSETGVAKWLDQHGHSVLPIPFTDGDLSRAILNQLGNDRSERDVFRSLPERDGRLVADSWLFEDVSVSSGQC